MAAMKITTKCRYGTRTMLALALRYKQGPVQLKEIASEQGISLKYLEHVIARLRRAELVKSIRGRKGGYELIRNPADITMHEIVKALEGSLIPVDCLDHPGLCPREETCATRLIWEKAQQATVKLLNATSLEELVNTHKKKLKTARK